MTKLLYEISDTIFLEIILILLLLHRPSKSIFSHVRSLSVANTQM